MSKPALILSFVIAALGVSPATFAQQHPSYVITNDDIANDGANTGTVFVPAPNGQLSVVKILHTGGTGSGGYFSPPSRVAIDNNAGCIFLSDSGSGDIAAFGKGPVFGKVGNYSEPGLEGSPDGIGMVVSQDGGFLYASYTESGNLQAWAIGSGSNACELTPVGQPVAVDATIIGGLGLTNDGKVLIVSVPEHGRIYAYTATNGLLTQLGSTIDLQNEQACSTYGCDPAGMDMTNVVNGKALVVFGNISGLSVNFITMALDEVSGLSFVSNTPITNAGHMWNPENPVFSRAARSGTGNLYIGMSGGGTGDCGFAILSVTNGVINPAAVANWDATLHNRDAESCSNIAIGEPLIGDDGDGAAIWQNDVDMTHGTNVMWLYRLAGNTIDRYGPLQNPNFPGSGVLSIASVNGNPN